ncbi:hypothetical protein [Christiangramia forsetii]|uniref:Membrane protein n=2 Tax=Christiangramia forsetii TaxID=411153 RepID=A0LXS1_CHRFK|nr:hypothetical protein [Christiangramia forsetii]GGG36087.1 hypothetical protein GCM10011532_19710 [Christiangramia forsetii]CAL65166.1 membrane protein [Christiangramia forsetii KT0803]
MERSIENIWKEGFESDKSFKLPVVKDLYNQKSKLIIEKIKASSRKDNISLIPMTVLLFGLFIFLGKILLGVYIGFLLVLLFIFNKRMLKRLDQMDLTANTYLYLTSYYSKLKETQKFYTSLVGIGLPVITIPGYWMYFWGTPVMSDFMSLDLIFQILIVLATAVILSGLGVLCYKLSTQLLYAKSITRLEEIINDMEALMKN